MKLRKFMGSRVRALSMAVAITSAGVASPSYAGGILTFDLIGNLTEILNAFEEVTALADQLSAIEEQYEQAESQFNETKSLLTGNSGYGALLNSTALNDYLPTGSGNDSWSSIYSSMNSSSLNGLRNKYNLKSENALRQGAYDTDLTNMNTLQKSFSASNLRLQNIKGLQNLADSANTPQEKEDIRARIALEQAAIANEKNRMDSSRELMAQNDKLLARQHNISWNTYLVGTEE